MGTQYDVFSVEFLYGNFGKEQNGFNGAFGVDAPMGKEVVLFVVLQVLVGADGADIQVSLVEHGIQATGNVAVKAHIGQAGPFQG